ncbi:hypothetical protein WOLCODRAFT_20966 [Wolfiporia cocos MD-104 SS10]|uniref:Uncharacterized protein n=1 Tax=Wolfiporia cocos (strain MD-104) TaxID=742152 RepID=A0A2H3JBI3_WOLCO|nr:hypothetical protein WOLCODRAFT_20966 [Wolfiporia cocos MD-104 SS10]
MDNKLFGGINDAALISMAMDDTVASTPIATAASAPITTDTSTSAATATSAPITTTAADGNILPTNRIFDDKPTVRFRLPFAFVSRRLNGTQVLPGNLNDHCGIFGGIGLTNPNWLNNTATCKILIEGSKVGINATMVMVKKVYTFMYGTDIHYSNYICSELINIL